jgi:site-specific recombinase XerD
MAQLPHGFATMLRQSGVDLKTAQEMLRHANSRTTLEIYQQSVTEERRAAQKLVMEKLFSPCQEVAPFSTLIGQKK